MSQSARGHGCGTFDLQIGTMAKADRQQAYRVYVVGFVPCHLMPDCCPNCLDPFLKPLLTELTDLFINRIEVDYPLIVEGIPARRATLRAILLTWTGDHPAQCEIAKSTFCGKNVCRRCLVPSERSTYYYYGNCATIAREPPTNRELETELPRMKEVEEEERCSVAQARATKFGFTGVSSLHTLHSLYSFNVLSDIIMFETMHGIAPNVVKKYIKWIIARVVEFAFHHSRNVDAETTDLFHNPCLKYNILTERERGLTSCCVF